MRRRRRTDVLAGVRRRRRARDPRRARPPPAPRSADLPAADVADVLAPVARPPDGQGGAGDGRARRRAARRRAVVRRATSASTRDRIPSGVSVGIHPTIDELLAAVAGYLDDGYVRIKLKIEPGWDLEPVAAVRRLIGPDMPLQVDANTAYTRQRRRPPRPARRVRPAADRAAAARGRPARPRPARQRRSPRRSASTSRSRR